MRETTVENGKVRGIPCGWPSITAYYGIPYAAPPVGELRWKAPQPAADWEGVRDCARASAKCPQLGVASPFFIREFYPCEEEMSEDCRIECVDAGAEHQMRSFRSFSGYMVALS